MTNEQVKKFLENETIAAAELAEAGTGQWLRMTLTNGKSFHVKIDPERFIIATSPAKLTEKVRKWAENIAERLK